MMNQDQKDEYSSWLFKDDDGKTYARRKGFILKETDKSYLIQFSYKSKTTRERKDPIWFPKQCVKIVGEKVNNYTGFKTLVFHIESWVYNRSI